MQDKLYDIAVVGGGVIGGFIARELTKYNLSVVILEKESEVASGSSKANSGIVHAGFDAKEGSLKAKFNVLGSRLMPKICKQLGVKYKKNGSIVFGSGIMDEIALRELYIRGEKNGVRHLKVLNQNEVRKLVPNVGDGVTNALYAKDGGIVCPYGLTIAAIGNAMDNGADLICDFEVKSVIKKDGIYTLSNGETKQVKAKLIVNACGNGGDKVSHLFGDDSVKIGARKGEYMILDKSVGNLTPYTLFTVPSKAGKGILISATVDGNIIVGPTAVEQDEFDTSIRREAFDEIKEKANAMVKNIPYGSVITSFAGVRNYSSTHDFVIGFSSQDKGLYNVIGIESPGLTSAPAIGVYVAKEIAKVLKAKKNRKFNPIRRSSEWFKKLSDEEKTKVIKAHPEYGKTVCRCENVSLGEILEALRNNPKATTIDGVKLRTRAGMGRCQGGFCQPSVFNEIMKEYGYTAEQVTKNGGTSYIIKGGEI